ncbi:cation:proton antiporter [Terrisporobacter glycolicus]|uniref:cation:proton antiporter n=1 Tax=Terrisporobacter petrolearius TaxID=1460447 RepID=UPI0008ED47FB|nr:sodium/proton-potassium antiporter GerN, CPA2 family [Terrisporobacter glycolicus]
MESYSYILDIALILISTKLFGLISRRCQMPQVVGALFAGLILGPAVLNIVHETEFLTQLAEIGVILLMFFAGLETDISELKQSGKASLVTAILGIIVPLAGGFFVAMYFNSNGLIPFEANSNAFLQNIFIGTILTATSVSITVETLKEMGKLNSKVGNTILGAAIIDDILGIVALTIVISFANPDVNIFAVLLKIFCFFIFAAIASSIFYFIFKNWLDKDAKHKRRYVIAAFAFCLLLSYISETYFGVADITGAFIAGLTLSPLSKKYYIEDKLDTVSYALLSPIFFASIGLKLVLPKMTPMIILFAVILTIVAVLSKIVGCGLGCKLFNYSNRESLQVGFGMVSRGEVALIVANKGFSAGLINTTVLAPILIVVIATTILSPILLKMSYNYKINKNKEKLSAIS